MRIQSNNGGVIALDTQVTTKENDKRILTAEQDKGEQEDYTM